MIVACRPSLARRLGLVILALMLTSAARPGAVHEGERCTRAIQAAERAYDLPAGLLMAVALTETGRRIGDVVTPWPWSINAAGEGAWLDGRGAALAHTRELQARGVESIDVGCMQVNLRWHEAAFDSLEAAFDPRANVAYAARHLRELRAASRDWLEAAGRYHSTDPLRARAYLRRVNANWQATRMGGANVRIALPPAPGQIALEVEWTGGLAPLVDPAGAAGPLLPGHRGPLLGPLAPAGGTVAP
jgi:hypothetical protein